MRILIIGAGETGFYIASEFSEDNFDVALVDENPDQLKIIQRSLNVAGILGNGTSLSVLEQAGIQESDLIIACTDHDETNLICCLLADHYKVRHTIAVTRTASYLRRKDISRYLESGVTQIINSSLITAQEIVETANIASAAEVSAFGKKNVLLIGYKIREDSPWKDLHLTEIRKGKNTNQFLIASIVREGKSFIPDGSSQIQHGDYVYILTPRQNADDLNELLDEKIFTNRRAVIAGDNQIAERVAIGLLKSHYSVTMICQNELRLSKIKKIFSSKKKFAAVLGSPEVVKLQLQLDVSKSSLFIAVSNDDSQNIAACIVAQYLGVRKTICLVNKQEIIPSAEKSGIDVIISPRLSTARLVKKLIRGGEASLNYTTISETNMEVIEVITSSESSIINQPLKDISLPPNCLIGAIIKDQNKVVIPSGNTILEPDDQVIIVTMPENAPIISEMLEGHAVQKNQLIDE